MNKITGRPPYVTYALVGLIVAYWVVVALLAGQSLLATQGSQLLLHYGAVNDQVIDGPNLWRIITSQFMHTDALHMLLNIGFVLLIGTYVEKLFGSKIMLLVYLLGGSIGQYVSVLAYPNLVSSGASQALCSLAGFLVAYPKIVLKTKLVAIAVILFVGLQTLLDLRVSGHLKAGHVVGFISGLVIGFGISIYRSETKSIKPRPV